MCIAFLLVPLFILTMAAAYGYAILKPFADAVHGHKRPTRFVTSDFLCLMAWLTLPMGYLSAARRWNDNSSSPVLVLGTLLIGIFMYAWWRGAATLSGLGIYQPRRRTVFLLVILPLAVLGAAIGVPLLAVLTFSIPHTDNFYRAIWLCGVAGLSILVLVLRRLGGWVLSEPKRHRDMAEQGT